MNRGMISDERGKNNLFPLFFIVFNCDNRILKIFTLSKIFKQKAPLRKEDIFDIDYLAKPECLWSL